MFMTTFLIALAGFFVGAYVYERKQTQKALGTNTEIQLRNANLRLAFRRVFVPSSNGFKFPNSFPDNPVFSIKLPLGKKIPVGNASGGLCGGMVFTAYDYFLVDKPVPLTDTPPPPDSPLFKTLVRRLFNSWHIPWGILRFYYWQVRSDETLGWWNRENWSPILEKLQHRPVVLGLVRAHSWNPWHLGSHHQVLAVSCGTSKIYIYDPNYPGQNDITLILEADGSVTHSLDGSTRGVFEIAYIPLPPAEE